MSESKLANSSGLSHLSEISRATNVLSDSAELPPYAIGGATPAGIVRPESEREVAEIVKVAASEKLAIVVCGARTKLAMGMPPRQYDLAVDMTRLNHILAYDPGDLTMSVEPSVPLAELAHVLAEHKQFLPLAVPFFARATAGGTIGSGVDSLFRQFYGTVRDYVLGMEFVTGDGVLAKSGGRVVKNVAGYDLHKLMIGAHGTLGVITKINFRTFPAPAETRAFVAACESAGKALEIRRHVAESVLRPLTMEIVSPVAAELMTSEAARPIEPGLLPEDRVSAKQWGFMCSFAGNERALERYERDLQELARAAGATDGAILRDEHLRVLLGRLREFVPIALQSSPATTIVKLSVLPARMEEMLNAIARAAETSGIRWATIARGLGVIYGALLRRARDEDNLKRVADATDSILGECQRLGGNGSIPWCPAEWKGSLKVWGPARSDFEQMRKLKNVFDPRGILAPGRFVGGL
jgi:glycolate oxidase FAD binding subunit